MQKVFDEINSLDNRCYTTYHLSEDILMEHASYGIYDFIVKKFQKGSSIIIVSGSGNNGADGIALSRMLCGDFDVCLYLFKEPKTQMGKLQLQRAKSVGVPVVQTIEKEYDIVIDALFGTGLNRTIEKNGEDLILNMNSCKGYKIACDIPSGIFDDGTIDTIAFKADITITMGGLKKALFLDMAKDYVGEIVVVDLGICRTLYEGESDCYLLEANDLQLPHRTVQNAHKGDFGHLAVVAGEKEGAAILSAMAGFYMGAGLVTLVSHQKIVSQPYLMQSHFIPKNTTAIVVGMGLGKYDQKEILELLNNDIPKVVDADLFYTKDICTVLDKNNIILTPHPKEFCALLRICGVADISVNTLQSYRFKYVQLFIKKYPKITLLLKGANTLIGDNGTIYINPLGTSNLSFGGSGDVLAGFIASFLAQGYSPLHSVIQGSLVHTLSGKNTTKNSFSLNPLDIIQGVAQL